MRESGEKIKWRIFLWNLWSSEVKNACLINVFFLDRTGGSSRKKKQWTINGMIVYKIDCFSPNSSSFKHCVRVVDQVFLFSFLKRVFWWLYVPLVHVWVEPFNLSRTESTNSYNRRVSEFFHHSALHLLSSLQPVFISHYFFQVSYLERKWNQSASEGNLPGIVALLEQDPNLVTTQVPN